jgi:hypothetical protein
MLIVRHLAPPADEQPGSPMAYRRSSRRECDRGSIVERAIGSNLPAKIRWKASRSGRDRPFDHENVESTDGERQHRPLRAALLPEFGGAGGQTNETGLRLCDPVDTTKPTGAIAGVSVRILIELAALGIPLAIWKCGWATRDLCRRSQLSDSNGELGVYGTKTGFDEIPRLLARLRTTRNARSARAAAGGGHARSDLIATRMA